MTSFGILQRLDIIWIQKALHVFLKGKLRWAVFRLNFPEFTFPIYSPPQGLCIVCLEYPFPSSVLLIMTRIYYLHVCFLVFLRGLVYNIIKARKGLLNVQYINYRGYRFLQFQCESVLVYASIRNWLFTAFFTRLLRGMVSS